MILESDYDKSKETINDFCCVCGWTRKDVRRDKQKHCNPGRGAKTLNRHTRKFQLAEGQDKEGNAIVNE